MPQKYDKLNENGVVLIGGSAGEDADHTSAARPRLTPLLHHRQSPLLQLIDKCDSRAGIKNLLEWLFSSSLASYYQDLHLLLFSYTKAKYTESLDSQKWLIIKSANSNNPMPRTPFFMEGYKKWIFHGEYTSSRTSSMINLTYPDTAYHHAPDEEPNEEVAKFYNLLNEMNEELYEGSKYLKLSFCIRLFHLKCLGGWNGNVFTMLLEFLREMFPFAKIPQYCQDMKSIIKDLGLGYDKIHSCPNDCMLYWGDQKNQQSCHVCGKSRWMNRNTEDVNMDEGGAQLRKKPTADSMRWHNDQRADDGLLRHPADSLAWKSFHSKFPSFASDPQNVRLGLAVDGFNPIKIMSTSYSTWPPFIEELKQLWLGVETCDVLRKGNFNLRTALLWTINDFSAYANLSSWSTKGRYACPCCATQTCSKWLYNGKKFSYMGHRRWLDGNHKFRFQRTLFDGTDEYRGAPEQTIGSEILFMLKDINFSYGKMNQPHNMQTKRRSRDESDEEDDPNENVYENIIGTILNVDGKSKDTLQSQLDLVNMRIRRDLHPQDIKVLDAYASNISRCVSLKDRRLYSLKSHDYHILMQDLLLVALRCFMSKNVTSCIIKLSNIMKAICGKVLDVEELEKVQDRAALTLSNLEKIFLPSLFSIMVHLVIHLPHEAILGGPVFYRWMYPIEKC
ncbi:hypothetical protein CXB51_014698 [Gossypium anomalum]|uniref:DUF4218 domain-containing protein n=1 Tax=Gossypium anomalum TaxID=47600 RepID=A0A8J5YX56_9ROSI|nr:hypothetical protein CXB51_014698 [Gossypium anomalum]